MKQRLTKDAFKMRVRVCILTGTPCYADCRKCLVAVEHIDSKKGDLGKKN